VDQVANAPTAVNALLGAHHVLPIRSAVPVAAVNPSLSLIYADASPRA